MLSLKISHMKLYEVFENVKSRVLEGHYEYCYNRPCGYMKFYEIFENVKSKVLEGHYEYCYNRPCG